MNEKKTALLLSGGGARGAYQIGVLSAIASLLPKGSPIPFKILCGTSAGALNAALLATQASDFKRGVKQLSYIWRHLTPDQVYRVSRWPIASSITKTLASAFLQQEKGASLSLMVNDPLEALLTRFLNLDKVSVALHHRFIETLAITAINYSDGNSTTFFQTSNSSLSDWHKGRRVGTKDPITIQHLLASSAIPGIFPPRRVGTHYFGDGAVRLGSAIQPAINLGAEKLLLIGVSDNRQARDWASSPTAASADEPSIVQVLGQLLNSAFIDSIDQDIANINELNKLLSLVPEENRPPDLSHRETLIISPSSGLNVIAREHINTLPRNISRLLRTASGNKPENAASAASYLLFTPEYCQALIELGYKDAMWEKEKIQAFLEIN
ncbi:patatin-like phospholipase family protein [Marinomonas piezotolerans]|uniref:Patatin-like phospholipase family protein n=1 Tax=Marinomonas piezotolerans TaxID=2213058 RepID=A0A370UE71_9GAMM|nr:patatin-like phospholipase family protein [Marinomonas piezotolerans]RDL46086.1 patatin-like phospholipase family protein [Marinomonas piezotolerans]